ncbi:MAG: hypothetical protein ISS94_01480 [Candidatus Syntrophoarchaeum sp.]|nr:hypothetical protein [Methanomicrobia archaeon]MBL7117444.1 hypothetical protein [Candidatus Syntrophoarchaeum sp.]
MAEEEIVFQLLEEDRKLRLERIVEDRKITTDDCLVLGILKLHSGIWGVHKRIDGLHKEIAGLHEEIGGLHKRIDDTNARIEELRIDTNAQIEELGKDVNGRMESNFKWTVSLILGTWASMIAILIPILLKVMG